jgi:hypothetical protein
MPRKLRALRADLRREGFKVQRQKGSHQTWVHPLLAGVGVELAGQDGADAHSYQERQVSAAIQRAHLAQQQLQQRKGPQP